MTTERLALELLARYAPGMVSYAKHSWKQWNGAAVFGRAATIWSLPFGGPLALRSSNEVPFQTILRLNLFASLRV